MKMKRIKCSNLEQYSKVPTAAKEVLKHSDKKISVENDMYGTEPENFTVQEKIQSKAQDFSQPLFYALNPKTKTNFYKCSNLEKYTIVNKKSMPKESKMLIDEDVIDIKENKVQKDVAISRENNLYMNEEELADNILTDFTEKIKVEIDQEEEYMKVTYK